VKKTILVEKGGNLLPLIREELLSGGRDLSAHLIIFPGQRPGHFLRKVLAESLGSAHIAPEYSSLDDWIEKVYRQLGHHDRSFAEIDAVAMLYRLHKQKGMPGEAKALALDEFVPWGYKLFSDFEELKIEGREPEALRRIQVLAEDRLPPRVQSTLKDLAGLYESFYEHVREKGCATRSMRYRKVADECQRIDLSGYRRIILAGFFALTAAEKRIFQTILSYENATLLLQDGPGITRLLESLDLPFERPPARREHPEIHYYRAPDAHGQVMQLNRIVKQDSTREGQVVVLPESGTLGPVVQHTLPLLGDQWNVSMGFPLFRTPVHSLLRYLNRVLESMQEGRYFVPDYLKLVLQPYVKNLFLNEASYPTRILFHTVEEVLSEGNVRFAALEEIEKNERLMLDASERLTRAGPRRVGAEEVARHLQRIHDVLLRPFEKLTTMGEFCENLLRMISFISQESPADLHPYTSRFIKSLIEALAQLRLSDMASESLSSARAYFAVLDAYIKNVKVPFKGTPLKAFQILGFLETRSLSFNVVYFLDANEDVIPRSRKEDTLLPMGVRNELGLSTYRSREEIIRYYFENLVAAAEQVHIFYRQDKDKERSRLVERLIWEKQKEVKDPSPSGQEVVFFESVFGQRDPEPIVKDEASVARLRSMSFSASALEKYLQCPIRFYYERVLGLGPREELGDSLESSEVGNIVHSILSIFFETKKGKPLSISKGDYKAISTISDQVFRETLGDEATGSSYLTRSQVDVRLKDILDHHRSVHRGVTIIDCERPYSVQVQLPSLGDVRFTGKIDRIHRQGNETFIVDYKTGEDPHISHLRKFDLEERSQWYKTFSPLQIPFYLFLYLNEARDSRVEELNSGLMLLKPRKIKEDYLFKEGDDRESIYRQYEAGVCSLVSEILDPEMEWSGTPDPAKNCGWCPFKALCGRQWVVNKFSGRR
jgi:ATP-dependent helicase/nuclease subunit B